MSESHAPNPLTGDRAILARRYAGALYDLSQDASQTEVVVGELQKLQALHAESSEFRAIIANPRFSRNQLSSVVGNLADVLGIGTLVSNFLKLLAKNRRLSILEGIINAFDDLLAAARHEQTVEVVSAKDLNDSQKSKLEKALEAATGGSIRLRTRVDSSLLGGVQIKIGSRQVDASLRGKLARLEKDLIVQTEAA